MLQNSIVEENQLLSGAESQQAEVRVAFGEEAPKGAADLQAAGSEDQQVAEANNPSIDEISLDDADDAEENRNKRSATSVLLLRMATSISHSHCNTRVGT